MTSCIDCQHPATRWIGFEGRIEGPYPACDMCTHHTVKNRGGVDIGAYDEESVPVTGVHGTWRMPNEVDHHFTFGTDHCCDHPNMRGPIADYWVTVRLPKGHPVSHRHVFVEEFMKKFCDPMNPYRFAFEYRDEYHKPQFFPRGQLVCIKVGVEP